MAMAGVGRQRLGLGLVAVGRRWVHGTPQVQQQQQQQVQRVAHDCVAAAVSELEAVLGAKGVSTASAVCDQHGHDESFHPPHLPDAGVVGWLVGRG